MSTHEHSVGPFQHDHHYLGEHHDRNARKTRAVIALCAVMMAVEIVGGYFFHSMALVADGFHMSTHAGALLIAAWAYGYARRHASDARFAFGTGKLGELAAFSSALILAMIAILIGYESVARLIHPLSINFDEALPIAGLGLCVNIASAWLLRDDHSHARDHSHDHGHTHSHDGHHTHDLNMRAAYVHVIADAAVSVLAIIGLLAGRELGLVWMDPVMGIIGTFVIASWSRGLIRDAGGVLLDVSLDDKLAGQIRQCLERGADRVADLHLWRLGPGHNAVIATLVTDKPLPASEYKTLLCDIDGLSHITIEVEACRDTHANSP